MLPQITTFIVEFDRPYRVRITLAGLNRFQKLTGKDPFDLIDNGQINQYLTKLIWSLAVIDHPKLTLATVERTLTFAALLNLGASITRPTAPTLGAN